MRKIYFELEDVVRIDRLKTLGPETESIFALDAYLYGRGRAITDWRRRVRGQLGELNQPISALAGVLRPVPELLWLLDERLEPDPGRLAATGLTADQLAGLVQRFGEAVVAPYWTRVLAHLDGEERARARGAAGTGLESFLRSLHSRIRWNWPILEVRGGESGEFRLDRQGLLIVPSAFLLEQPALLIERVRSRGRPALIVSAAPSPEVPGGLWTGVDTGDEALCALVGRTRAKVLQSLRDGCTTGELARRLGISAAAVSQHTGVLRDAGLITTLRSRNTVLHNLTALGEQLTLGRMLVSN
ncbi:ArsR/SmtB family transcription factor [Amycolatopsis anabasis]|uniref:ArsR/SmtB family transcription factor n=1 Tax=Amycolatopsis anabasis TaxID=1840409 RepID=UPI00131BF652|nr:winged helix-turn-helix domain-containing protein [Amycolatopsis anabasis]